MTIASPHGQSAVAQTASAMPDVTRCRAAARWFIREKLKPRSATTIGLSLRFSQDKLVLENLPNHGARYIENDREVTFGVSIPLPLFNRQQGAIAESVSQRVQAKAQREATELMVRREVAAAYRSYDAARKTMELLRTGVVGQNQESFQIVRLAYQLGELRLLDVINQQRILIDAQAAFSAAERDYYVAAADLDRALGR